MIERLMKRLGYAKTKDIELSIEALVAKRLAQENDALNKYLAASNDTAAELRGEITRLAGEKRRQESVFHGQLDALHRQVLEEKQKSKLLNKNFESSLLEVDRLTKRLNRLLGYKPVQRIVQNIDDGRARK
jgi:hypothetical protein